MFSFKDTTRKFSVSDLESFIKGGFLTNKGDNQVKWPTQMPVYRGADTENLVFIQGQEGAHVDKSTKLTARYDAAGKGWQMVPWLGLDDFHKDRSVFSIKTTFKNELLGFFSNSNYNSLLADIMSMLPDVNKAYVEKVVREEMIEVFKMHTPRMDPTDPRTFLSSNEVTLSYVENLNARTFASVVSKITVEMKSQRIALEIKAGPKQFMPNPINTQLRNTASDTPMDGFLQKQKEKPRVAMSDATTAFSDYTSNQQYIERFLS